MDIYNQINEKKNEITRKITILELDSRFSELVALLKQKK